MEVDNLKLAADLLSEGAVVGVPTDTVYGIAVDADDEHAVIRLFALKRRPLSKPIGLLVADFATAQRLVSLPDYALDWIKEHWPGPLNLVGRARLRLPPGIGDPDLKTVGVRVPNHPVTLALLAEVGPLGVTSANISGGEETLNELEAERVLGQGVAFYLPGECPGAMSSTTVDVTGSAPKLLRKGPLELGLRFEA